MKDTLTPGVRHQFAFALPPSKMVPALYPESPEFQDMPDVLATGFLVGLLEWTCIRLLKPHLDDGEGSLGTHVNFSHLAATPAGHTVTVDAEVTKIDGRRVWFRLSAHDGDDLISEGEHERAVVVWERFNQRAAHKANRREAAE